MQEPRNINLFTSIRDHGQDALRTANNLCDDQEKLASTYQKLQFNQRCKREKVYPKSIIKPPPIRTREAFVYFQETVPKQTLKFFINDNFR